MHGSERQVVLITGATGKLGRSFAIGFASAGFDVVISTRNAVTAGDLRRECEQSGAGRVEILEVDLLAAGASRLAVEKLGKLDLLPTVLVNNARNINNLVVAPDGITTRAQWQDEFQLGVITPYELTLAMADANGCRLVSVVNIASMYGITAPNLLLYDDPRRQSPVNYGVVKAALIHLTRELGVRLAERGIRVNAVSFGGVEGRASETFKERYAKLCPAGRMLKDSEVFGAVRFLASDASSGMTGHNLVVDGGWTVW